ncbi:MAG: sulfotransferase, partial [Rhizobiaceae bacterium]|nr:sulfotransferase [Rhizobiaceae bacterium]
MQRTAPSGRRTCIMVLGMHRSGTSALTRVVSLLGVALPSEVLGANPTNPTGHWEPLRLITLHDQMLAEAGSRWDDWRAFDWGELPRRRADHYRAEIARILLEEYGQAGLFVLKEPRLARFVPLYAEIFADLGIEVVYVHTKRNPLAVAHSLEKRDNFSPAYGLLLWLRHELEAEKATRGGRRVFVSYERLIGDWRDMLARIDDNLALEWPRSPDEAAAEIDAYLSAEHRHHTESEAMLKADPRVPAWVKDAYAALRALGANPQDSQAELVLDRIGAEFGAPSPVFGQAFYDELTRRQNLLLDAEHHWRETAEARAAELANLAAETGQSAAEAAALIEQAQQEREALQRELAEKESSIHRAGDLSEQTTRLRQELAARDEQLAELARATDARIAELLKRQDQLEGELDARERELKDLAAATDGRIEQLAFDAIEAKSLFEREHQKLHEVAKAADEEMRSLILQRDEFARAVGEAQAEISRKVTELSELRAAAEERDRMLAQKSLESLEADMRHGLLKDKLASEVRAFAEKEDHHRANIAILNETLSSKDKQMGALNEL